MNFPKNDRVLFDQFENVQQRTSYNFRNGMYKSTKYFFEMTQTNNDNCTLNWYHRLLSIKRYLLYTVIHTTVINKFRGYCIPHYKKIKCQFLKVVNFSCSLKLSREDIICQQGLKVPITRCGILFLCPTQVCISDTKFIFPSQNSSFLYHELTIRV